MQKGKHCYVYAQWLTRWQAIIGRSRRRPTWRRVENYLRSHQRHHVTLGDTNSSFFRPGWMTIYLVDADIICDLGKDVLPFDPETIDAVYSSHMIDEPGLQLPRHIFRSLKPGGFCRLVAPDMDLLLDRYQARDWRFFLAADGSFILSQICRGILPPESLLMHNRLVCWFASYSARMDTAGGPIVPQHVVDDKLCSLSKYEFSKWCVSLLEPGRTHAHVHLYDYDQLHGLLESARFRDIRKLTWGQSACPEMLNSPIDRQEHRMYSLYVEATK